MKQVLKFQDGAFDSYELAVEENHVELNCYLAGSLAGGTGTECWHSIKGGDLRDFVREVGVLATLDLPAHVDGFAAEDWKRMHRIVQTHQTGCYTWSETDWD